MKTKIKKISAGVVTFVFLILNACTDGFEEMNMPHNLLLDDKVNIDMMFTGVLYSLCYSNMPNGYGQSGNYSGMSVAGDNRPFEEGEGGPWGATYGAYGRNLSDIIRLCKKRDAENANNENVHKMAIARILQAWNFARATDSYGNMPYFESCLAIEDAIFTPKYDSQKDIYLDVLKELKEAVAQLAPGEGILSYGNADFVYRGNIEKWRKLANSLRLRLALRVRYADQAMAQSNMSDLTEDMLIISNSDNFTVSTNTQHTRYQNPLYADLVERGYRVTTKRFSAKTMLDILNDNDDPRLKVYCDTAKATFQSFGYRGLPLLGLSPVQQRNPYGQESVSKWSDLFYVPVIGRSLYKASETYFSLAEAALFGLKGSASDAQRLYEKGLEIEMAHSKAFFDACEPQLPAIIRLWNRGGTQEEIDKEINDKRLTQDEIDDFLANAPVATLTGSNEEKLEQIINQKLFSYFPNEAEAWAEKRRTGYPRVLIGDDTDALRGQIPRRMPWPTSEQLRNIDQYNKALELLGGPNNRLTKIWWDANPDPIKPHPGKVEWMEQQW